MLPESHFEVEKRSDSWRVSARGAAAVWLSILVGGSSMLLVGVWVWDHVHKF
jgi:hypothetical protein